MRKMLNEKTQGSATVVVFDVSPQEGLNQGWRFHQNSICTICKGWLSNHSGTEAV